MEGNADEWVARHEEVQRLLSADRRSFRALAEARCAKDSRLLGAAYRMRDGIWLWYRGQRLTPEEAQRESHANAAAEFEALTEDGFSQQEAWEMTLGIVEGESFCSPTRSAYDSQGVVNLGSQAFMKTCYLESSLADIRKVDRVLRGEFSSCPRCRLTYIIEYSAMSYASGKSIVDRSRSAIIITPGRVVPSGAKPQYNAALHYGMIHSWQATPWMLI